MTDTTDLAAQVAATIPEHGIEIMNLRVRDAAGRALCTCGAWITDMRSHWAEVAVAVIAERAWIVPKVEHDTTGGTAAIWPGNWIRLGDGFVDPAGAREHAARLLAAADRVEAQAVTE